MNLISLKKAGLVLGLFAAMATAQAQVTVTTAGGTIAASGNSTFNFVVSGVTASATSVNITLNTSGIGGNEDWKVTLTSPSGVTTATVFDSAFGGTPSDRPLSGSNQNNTKSGLTSFNALSVGNLNGTWTLTIDAKDWAGSATLNNTSSLTVVPEPATYAAAFGALAMTMAAYRRMKK